MPKISEAAKKALTTDHHFWSENKLYFGKPGR